MTGRLQVVTTRDQRSVNGWWQAGRPRIGTGPRATVHGMPAGSDAVTSAVLVVVFLLAVSVFVLVRRARARGLPRNATAVEPPDGHTPQAAVIVHAVKVDDEDARRRQIEAASAQLGWAAPLWLETTADDPGRSQTRSALEAGADAVLAFGGDGTARIVAEGLLRTGVPLGLLPAGTGNLLARNLGVPPNRLETALYIALNGRDRLIDVGRAEVGPGDGSGALVRETFLVMAGLGFDAEVMADVDPTLKDRVGWWAYVVAGIGRLRGRRTAVTLTMDGGPPEARRIRAVVIGNCGMLTGGVQLMPEARLDDGWLDVVVVTPRTVLGWLSVVVAVLTRRRGRAIVEHLRCRSVEIKTERPLHVQLDGDIAGTARLLRAAVDPLALLVRVPDDE